jgi:hypothetical protein
MYIYFVTQRDGEREKEKEKEKKTERERERENSMSLASKRLFLIDFFPHNM